MKISILTILILVTTSTTSLSQCALDKNFYEFNYHGKKYEVVLQESDWQTGGKCARERGGYLARINDEEENNAIVNYLKNEFPIENGFSIVDGIYETNHNIWIGAVKNKDSWNWVEASKRDTFIEFYVGWAAFGYSINNSYVNWGRIDDNKHFPYRKTLYPQAVAITLNPYYDTTEARIKSSAGQWINKPIDLPLYYLIEYDCKDTLYEESSFTSCSGESIIFAGDTIRESGIYSDTTESYASCDSISTISVYINNMNREVTFDGRIIRALEQEADSFKWYNCYNDSVEIDNDEDYYLPLKTGKYKVKITKDLCEFTSDCYEVCFPNQYRLDTLKCEGDPITINNVEYTKSGYYVQDLKQVGFDCDSTLEIDITNVRFDKRIRESNDTLISFETGAEYQWYNCEGDVLIADATQKEYAPTKDGDYKVEITKQGCIDYSICYNYSTISSSVKDIQDSENIRLDEVNRLIVFNNKNYDQIELMDMNSKTIYKTDQLTQSISIDYLTTGVYFLKIVTGKDVEMFKFMVVE